MPNWGIFSLSGLRHYGRALRAVRRIVKREGITQLHCGACLPDGWIGYLSKKMYGLPYILYMHGEELCYTCSSRELEWMSRKVFNSARIVVANSQNTRNILLDKCGLSDERIRVLTPGVDCGRFRPAAPDRQIRRCLGWENRKVVLTVGRLQKRKGHDALIRALPQIVAGVPNVLYSIAGDGDERQSLERLVVESGLENFVEFRGETTDEELISCYQQCDVFVLPNRRIGDDLEGFGMVLVEAQACGKPVIAGNTGGTRETMRLSETGFTLDCDDLTALGQTIQSLLLDAESRQNMGRSARAWVTEQFDWPILAERAKTILFDNSSTPVPANKQLESVANR